MKRRTTRELLMQMLYEMSIQKDFGTGIRDRYAMRHQIPEEQAPYFNGVYEALREHKEEIDRRIDQALTSWSISTLGKVELAILRLGACEILYMSDSIGPSVSINEAVELAKKYGEERSFQLINGALGANNKKRNGKQEIQPGD